MIGAGLLVGCGEAAPSAPPEQTPHPLAACAEAATSPQTVLEVLDALETIPEPTLPCLVASLARPLSVVASESQFSAQPALDEENPRIFLLRPGLVLTVATAGIGENLLELGEWASPNRSLKAELRFPVTTPIPDAAPFERVLNDSPTVSGIATGCAVCHGEEEQMLEIDGVDGYSSIAYRPIDALLVPLAAVEAERRACSEVDRSARCDLLRALVDFGATQGSFDPSVPTFTD